MMRLSAFLSLTATDWLFGVGIAFLVIAAIGLASAIHGLTRTLKELGE